MRDSNAQKVTIVDNVQVLKINIIGQLVPHVVSMVLLHY